MGKYSLAPYKYASVRGQSRPEVETWGKIFIFLSIVSWGITPVIGIKNVVTILTIAGYIFAVIGLQKPSLGLIGISVLSTLDPMTRGLLLTGGLLRWNTLNYWLLLVIVFSFSLLVRLDNLQSRLLTLFLIVMGIGLLFSQNFENGLLHMLAILITFGILVYFIRAINDPDALYWSAVVCGWLAGAGGFFYFIQPGITLQMNPNVWAFFPLTAIFSACLAAHTVNEKKRRLFTLYILTAVNITWVFFSASRGDLVIGLIAIIVLLIASKGVSTRIILFIAVILAVLITSNQFDSLRLNAIARTTKTFDYSYTILQRTSGRSDLMKAGWYIFLNNPIGIGTGSFAPAWAELGSMGGELTFRMIGRDFSAHSGWVKVLVENGIPGILLLGVYVISFVVTGWRKKSFPTVGVLVSSCLAVALVTTEFQSKGLWYLAAGGIALINKESISKHVVDWEQGHRKREHSIRLG